MKQSPSFPKYAKDWLTGEGTRLMTPEQRGAFDWLLCHAWLSDPPCTLPDDDAALAKLSDLGRRWKTVGGAIRSQFIPHSPGRVVNRKLLAVWNEYQEFRERQSRSGKRGNDSRWQNDRTAIENGSPNDRSAIAKSSPPLPLPLPLPEEQKHVCICVCECEVPSDEKCGPKLLSSSQMPVHAVAASLRTHTFGCSLPDPSRIAAWIRDFGLDLIRETIHDLGPPGTLDNKPPNFLHKILKNRKENPNERPSNRTQRRSTQGRVIGSPTARRNPFADHRPSVEVGVDNDGKKRTTN